MLAEIDEDIAKVVEKSFKKKGVEILSRTSASGYKDGVLTYGDNQKFETQLVVVCVGRRPYPDLLGLDKTAVELDDKGFIKVDENLQTGFEGVYAGGDLINTPQLAHVGFC